MLKLYLDCGRAYIQASLHADELPGMILAHHLIKMLDSADKLGLISKEIIIVPFANPIGKFMKNYLYSSSIIYALH